MQRISPSIMLTPNSDTRMLLSHGNGGRLSPMSRSTSQTPVSPRIRPSFSATPETLTIQVRVLLQELCPPITIFGKATVFTHNFHPRYVHFLEVETGQKVRTAGC
jgi:hypothetical protein